MGITGKSLEREKQCKLIYRRGKDWIRIYDFYFPILPAIRHSWDELFYLLTIQQQYIFYTFGF